MFQLTILRWFSTSLFITFYSHSQTLAALKAWSHWLSQLHNLSLSELAYQAQCTDITSRIMVSVAPVLRDGRSSKLVHSAAHFMVTLTGTVRPPSIWKLKEFTELYNGLHQVTTLTFFNNSNYLLKYKNMYSMNFFVVISDQIRTRGSSVNGSGLS